MRDVAARVAVAMVAMVMMMMLLMMMMMMMMMVTMAAVSCWTSYRNPMTPRKFKVQPLEKL